jgi:ferric iron reductase protein FhuF
VIAELEPCLAGPFAHWRDLVALAPDAEGAMPGGDLLRPEVASDILERFGRTYPGADRRGVASMWTQWYFGAVVVPAAAAALVLDRSLPMALDDIGLHLLPDGRPRLLVLRDAGAPAAPGERFAPLLDGHVAPLIRALAPLFRVSAKLLWCNVATQLDWAVRELGESAVPAARAEGLARLSSPRLADGSRNPLCDAVCAQGAEPQRRVCCLRYLLPGIQGCGTLCPLPEISGRAT